MHFLGEDGQQKTPILSLYWSTHFMLNQFAFVYLFISHIHFIKRNPSKSNSATSLSGT